MTPQTQQALQDSIHNFARDVAGIIQRAVAESAGSGGNGRAGRGNDAADAATGGGRRGKKAKGAKAAKARGGGKGPSDDEVLKEVKREGGRRITQIAEAMGTESAAIVKQLKRLVADKKVKTTGQRRGTKYKAA